ncbi:MAG: GSCFA domain-containing protein [Chitinophagales bacterium]|nr:GSCFA domain-containing protein [Chitinophagales bacterium]MDW8418330.1 GSCFA domain-containing protein [Chitinophagales bacterium]
MQHSYRTVVSPSPAPFTIHHDHKILTVGSCFSENIGNKFKQYKFNICINPFGQQYNPYSIAQALVRLVDAQPYCEEDLVFHDELYHSFDHHGCFSAPTISAALENINTRLKSDAAFLRHADYIFLTFGTSHYFSLKENGRIVSNCHKLSGNFFDRKLFAPTEITACMREAISKVKSVNPGVKFILTISPVRYFAFGVYENSVSKAHLFTALHELLQSIDNLFYFPAYELVIDDLRDYRFYAEDMLHPNYLATQYVWEKICETFLSENTRSLLQKIDDVLMAARHRPRNPSSAAHRKFVQKYLQLIQELQVKHNLQFDDEATQLRNSLSEATSKPQVE